MTTVGGEWRVFSVAGADAKLESGVAVSARAPGDSPPYCFSGRTTIIIGGRPNAKEELPAESIASWEIPVDPPSIRNASRGFLVVACMRYFGGLHSARIHARVDIWLDDQQVDGFALRIMPPDHSDYFHRVPIPDLPKLPPFAPCQTIYAWPLRKEDLAPLSRHRVRVRLERDVRWDVDYVSLLVHVMPPRHRVFLSHSWEDKPTARALADGLSARGVGVWLDEAEIKLGDSLIEKIRQAIDSVEYVVVLLSRNSVGSEWVKKEVDVAMNQDIENRRVKVLPVRLDDCDLPSFLKGKLYASLKHPDELKRVLDMIAARLSADAA